MFPFGALVGKKEIMEIVDPSNTADNRVDIYGTHSGNPITMVASLATLELLEDGKLIIEYELDGTHLSPN